MSHAIEDHVTETLLRLRSVANSGFALALHFRFVAPAFVLQSYPREWSDTYASGGMVMRDPTVRWGMLHTGWCRWSDMRGTENNDVMQQAASHGIRFGATYATKSGKSRSIAFISRHDREITDDERLLVEREFEDLHAATLQAKTLSPILTQKLRDLSVRCTHR